ncbi:MAG: BamA/TamA family outer membrane protein, partial [Phenylobacterium sp.]
PSPPEAAADVSASSSNAARVASSKWHFFDEQDGYLDFSNFLAAGGFIPLPIIITEPAVDQGLGVAAVFLSMEAPREVTRNVLAAVKTGNGSSGVGLARSGNAFDGRLNYRVGVGHGKITLNAYTSFAPNQGLEYTNNYDYGLIGAAFWKLPDDRFSVGPLLDVRKLESQVDIPGLPEDFVHDYSHTLQTAALGLGLHFDSRNNPLTPTRGANAYVEGKFNREAFGSDRDFEAYDAHLYAFHEVSPKLRLGYKLELNAIRGDFPDYFAPAINLRGVQAQRYEGMSVASSELELTWQASPRWSLLTFGGVGSSDAGDRRFFKDSGGVWAGGVGFRYKLARKLGLDAGLDLAYGSEGAVFYIQFGHAWALGMD